MIDRTKIKKLPFYGKSRIANGNALFHFRIKKNGIIDSIYMVNNTYSLDIDNEVFGNTIKCDDAVEITREEWMAKLKEFKSAVSKFI